MVCRKPKHDSTMYRKVILDLDEFPEHRAKLENDFYENVVLPILTEPEQERGPTLYSNTKMRWNQFETAYPRVSKGVKIAGISILAALTLGLGAAAVNEFLDSDNDGNADFGDAPSELEILATRGNTSRADDTPNWQPVQIDEGGGAKDPFAINEDYMGYENYDHDIIIKNIKTNEEKIYNGADIDADDETIVYDTGEINIIDIDTQEESTAVDKIFYDFKEPKISNGKIVFREYNQFNKTHKIYEVDIETKEKELISHTDYCDFPDIYFDGTNHKIIYREAEEGKIYIKDMNTNTTERLTDSDQDESFPRIHGDYVVFDGGNIHLKNIKTGELKELGSGNNPSIHKNLVSWDHNGDVYIYDILKDKTTQLEIGGTELDSSVFDGEGDNDYVVYMKDNGFDNAEVWKVELNPETPEPINNAPEFKSLPEGGKINGIGLDILVEDQDGDSVIVETNTPDFDIKDNKELVYVGDYPENDTPAEVYLKATDAKGAYTEASLNIIVEGDGIDDDIEPEPTDDDIEPEPTNNVSSSNSNGMLPYIIGGVATGVAAITTTLVGLGIYIKKKRKK